MKFLILKRESLLLTQVFTPKLFSSHFNIQVKMYKLLMLYTEDFAGWSGNTGDSLTGDIVPAQVS